tara:strand:- start:178 stop:1062 length:885 start_codon:yes stop_codon:yes gene_type:complete
MDAFRQGIYIRDIHDLCNFTSYKIRPHTDFINTLGGRDVPENTFDDSLAPSNHFSGSAVSRLSFGGKGRMGARLSHRRSRRDLGQLVHFTENYFYDTADLNPVGIVKNHYWSLHFPEQMVNSTGYASFDGVIEPLEIRRVVDRTIIDAPFVIRSIHGSIDGSEDSYRRVTRIKDGFNIEERSAIRQTDASSAFLDAVETFGAVSGSFGGIPLPSAVIQSTPYISPFVDSSDRKASTVGLTNPPYVSKSIRDMFVSQSNFKDDDSKNFDIMMPRGYEFDYNESGFDSIAFGGLKK